MKTSLNEKNTVGGSSLYVDVFYGVGGFNELLVKPLECSPETENIQQLWQIEIFPQFLLF